MTADGRTQAADARIRSAFLIALAVHVLALGGVLLLGAGGSRVGPVPRRTVALVRSAPPPERKTPAPPAPPQPAPPRPPERAAPDDALPPPPPGALAAPVPDPDRRPPVTFGVRPSFSSVSLIEACRSGRLVADSTWVEPDAREVSLDAGMAQVNDAFRRALPGIRGEMFVERLDRSPFPRR